MADQDDKKDPPKGTTSTPSAKPGFDPKPVQLGGESLLERLTPYVKQIAIGLGVLALVLTVIFTVRYFRERSRQGETAELAKVLEVAEREVRPADQAPDPNDPNKNAKTFTTNKERAEATLAELQKQGGDAAGPVFRGSLLLQAGRVDDAINAYRAGQKAKGLDGVLAREGLGLALEAKAHANQDAAARQKGLEEALSVFQTMQPDEKGARRAYALYHQGRILGLLGKKAEAKAALEQAKTLDSDRELPTLIEERLASLGAP